MDDRVKYGLAIALVVFIFAIPFFINGNAKFGGADNAGSAAIQTQQPGYKPWFTWFWKPPPETESMLFALQAAIGGLIIGYFIGHERAKQENMKAGPDGRHKV